MQGRRLRRVEIELAWIPASRRDDKRSQARAFML
jgi:hypothetical protein